MSTPTKSERSNWFCKFIETLFASLSITNILTFAFPLLPKEFVNRFFGNIMILEIVIPVVFAIGFAIYWHIKEKKNSINSNKIHAWFRGILRYWLAFSISIYGFAKIFQTQFQPSILRDDMLVGGLNGFQLTWNFFAHSYILAVILGLTQIIGSSLLVFRKTTLLGVTILIPVMINIVLINVFYDIAVGAFINSLLYTFGLIFLLLLRFDDLKKVFLDYVSPLPNIGPLWLIYLAKFICIVGAGLFIGQYVFNDKEPKQFIGKWNVDMMIKNGDTIKAGQWLTDSTAWTTVYIENGKSIYFCPNPYFYEKKRSLFMDYSYDEKKKLMQIIYYEKKSEKPKDTTYFKVVKLDGKKMQLNAIFHKDTLEIHLSSVKKIK